MVVRESQLFRNAEQGSADFYAQTGRGAYHSFFEHDDQADWGAHR